MELEKLSVRDFLARSSSMSLRAKILRALSPLPSGHIPICAICFSDEERSFTIFNHLPVPERWDHTLQQEEEIYETVILEACAERYDDIEIGKAFQFSIDWRGGAAKFGPVEAMELHNGYQLEVFSVRDAKVHEKGHLGETYEFLIEMLVDTATRKWRLSCVTDLPLFLNLAHLES